LLSSSTSTTTTTTTIVLRFCHPLLPRKSWTPLAQQVAPIQSLVLFNKGHQQKYPNPRRKRTNPSR
jgi:hypothetical protein